MLLNFQRFLPILLSLFTAIAFLSVTTAAPAMANPRYASIVIDADTGAVLHQRHADKSLHPASLTKVMTLLLLFEAMESGNVRLNDRIYISQRAANEVPSKIGLKAGSSIRVEDAILALVTKSANDISTAIAEHLAGTSDRFAQRMTHRARSIGMSRTTFRNAHGLHHPQQVSTARDMAILARYVIHRYPNYYRYFSTRQFTYRGVTHNNHNRLMQTYNGMDGFKTGYINASGFNLIASAKRGNRRVIGVVFGGRSWKTRNAHMASLLDNAFRTDRNQVRHANVAPLAPVQVAAQTIPVPPRKPGQQTTTPAVVQAAAQIVQQPVEEAPHDVTGIAIQNVRTAINRGDYSELTGQGDLDAATSIRVETGLLAAAVYRGETEHMKRLQEQARERQQASNVVDQPRNLARQIEQRAAAQGHYRQAALNPTKRAATRAEMDGKWTVQIGAYTNRAATDTALRSAHAQLPGSLKHATPIVAPLRNSEGLLYRARLGNLTQEQAQQICQQFRDCLPIAPRN